MIKALLLILGATTYLYTVETGNTAATSAVLGLKNLYTDPQGLPETNILANR